MQHDQEMNALRQQWVVESPAPDLADRIIRHALAQPQRQPFMARLSQWLAPQHYPTAMKGLAFAACVMVAVVAYDGNRTHTSTAKDGTKVTYQKPMEQIVDELLLSDYQYSY